MRVTESPVLNPIGDAVSRQPWEIEILNLVLKVEREDPSNYMEISIALQFVSTWCMLSFCSLIW